MLCSGVYPCRFSMRYFVRKFSKTRTSQLAPVAPLFLQPVSPKRAVTLKVGMTTWLGWLQGLEGDLPALSASFLRFIS